MDNNDDREYLFTPEPQFSFIGLLIIVAAITATICLTIRVCG